MIRAQAKALGLARYFTGAPCKYGHVAERRTGDGSCVECSLIKNRRWQKENPERARAKSKKWRERNADILKARAAEKYAADPARYRAQSLAYYYRNRTERLLAAREWKQRNASHVLAYVKHWASQNKDRRAVAERNRNARKRAAEGTHSAKDVVSMMRMQRGRCASCRVNLRRVGYHVDHVVPLVLGGGNGPNNLQLLCPPCNLHKRAQDPIAWAQSLGRLL